MTTAGPGIRGAFSSWPDFNRRFRNRVADLTEEQLAIVPGPGRWPLWASIGHLACQRVFGLCDVAGEPGAAESPFPNAAFDCPGDDDLEHVWSSAQLVDALDRTFRIIDRALDTWTLESLDEVIRHPEWGGDREHPRGVTLQRSFAHDLWHMAEVNEALTRAGLEPIDLWS
jgi:hypothetical protein